MWPNAFTCQTKLRGWWHTFPRHGLTLRLTHYLSKSWSHVPPHIFNVIQYCTTVTPSQVLPLPLLQTCRCTTLHRSHPLTSDATALITTSCVLFYFILFYFILFYFILFYFILFYFILFYFILFFFFFFSFHVLEVLLPFSPPSY